MRKYIPVLLIVGGLGLFGFFSLWVNNSANTSSDQISSNRPSSTIATLEGVFETTTPCNDTKPPLPQILVGTKCEMTIWHITFRPDKTYTLLAAYGMAQQNTTGIKDGGTTITMQGTWTQEPDTKIIHLTDSKYTVSFIKISNELIHLLDSNEKMMIGNGGWSYTLNKISK